MPILDLAADSLKVKRLSCFYDFSDFSSVENEDFELYGWRPPVTSANGQCVREWFDANAGLESLRALLPRLERGSTSIDSLPTLQQIKAGLAKSKIANSEVMFAEQFEGAKQNLVETIHELRLTEKILGRAAERSLRFHLRVSPFFIE